MDEFWRWDGRNARYNIPTQRRFISPPNKKVPTLKRGITFNLISDDETRIFSYMTEVQSIGFRFSATNAIGCVFYIAKNTGKEKILQ
jgi:hypothetical protein